MPLDGLDEMPISGNVDAALARAASERGRYLSGETPHPDSPVHDVLILAAEIERLRQPYVSAVSGGALDALVQTLVVNGPEMEWSEWRESIMAWRNADEPPYLGIGSRVRHGGKVWEVVGEGGNATHFDVLFRLVAPESQQFNGSATAAPGECNGRCPVHHQGQLDGRAVSGQ
jgi:hypothetical protein